MKKVENLYFKSDFKSKIFEESCDTAKVQNDDFPVPTKKKINRKDLDICPSGHKYNLIKQPYEDSDDNDITEFKCKICD